MCSSPGSSMRSCVLKMWLWACSNEGSGAPEGPVDCLRAALPSEQRPHGVCAKLGPAEVVRAQEARPRFSGVQLGRLIGTGSFGRVYKGERPNCILRS